MDTHSIFRVRLENEFKKLNHKVDDSMLDTLAGMAVDMLDEIKDELLYLLRVFVGGERTNEIVSAVSVLKNGPGLTAATYCLTTERVLKLYFRSYMEEG